MDSGAFSFRFARLQEKEQQRPEMWRTNLSIASRKLEKCRSSFHCQDMPANFTTRWFWENKTWALPLRGSVLVAFNVRDGSEVWRWNSGGAELNIIMATAGGGCAVETPEGLVLVEDGERLRVLAPRGSELYGLGLFLQNDPHGVAMLGEGIKPD